MPTTAGGTAAFDLVVSAAGAPAGSTVSAQLYGRLGTRSGFEQVVKQGPDGYPISTSAPAAISSLPPDAHSAGAVDLDLSVSVGATTGAAGELGLGCAPPTGTGTCTGVYPVVVALADSAGKSLAHFTTFLTYSAAKSAHPLELAWVVPVSVPVTLRTGSSISPTNALTPPTKAQRSSLVELLAQLRASTSVPVTIDATPATLEGLESEGSAGRAAVATLAAMSADPALYEIPPEPFVPIDIGSLAGGGQPAEITAEMAEGATVLARLRVVTTTSLGVWISSGTVGNDVTEGLSRIHASRLVLPDEDLAPTPVNSGTWAATFDLPLGPSTTRTVSAAESDGVLTSELSSDGADPALAATRFLADLAMVHFELPNTDAVRGLIAVPPAGWTPNPTFDAVVLGALAGDPVVSPVTLSTYFSTVTPEGTRHLGTTGTGPVLPSRVARALSRSQARLSAFDSALASPPTPPVAGELSRVLLATVCDELTRAGQARALQSFTRTLDAQLGLVAFAKGSTFTLTARTGVIPITIVSHAGYSLSATLSLTSSRFTFPGSSLHGATTLPVTLDHLTNPIRVAVVARSPGDLPLQATLVSPKGDLVIARGELTVRSTATSVVGIVLTAVALALLLAWWARTWWRGRRRRREAGTAA